MLLGAYGIKDQRKSSTSHERDLDAGSTQARSSKLDASTQQIILPARRPHRRLDAGSTSELDAGLDACSMHARFLDVRTRFLDARAQQESAEKFLLQPLVLVACTGMSVEAVESVESVE